MDACSRILIRLCQQVERETNCLVAALCAEWLNNGLDVKRSGVVN